MNTSRRVPLPVTGIVTSRHARPLRPALLSERYRCVTTSPLIYGTEAPPCPTRAVPLMSLRNVRLPLVVSVPAVGVSLPVIVCMWLPAEMTTPAALLTSR